MIWLSWLSAVQKHYSQDNLCIERNTFHRAIHSLNGHPASMSEFKVTAKWTQHYVIHCRGSLPSVLKHLPSFWSDTILACFVRLLRQYECSYLIHGGRDTSDNQMRVIHLLWLHVPMQRNCTSFKLYSQVSSCFKACLHCVPGDFKLSLLLIKQPPRLGYNTAGHWQMKHFVFQNHQA